MTFIISKKSGGLNDAFYGSFSVNVACMAAAVFVFVKYNMPVLKHDPVKKLLKNVSDSTFGIYLVHMLIMNLLRYRLGWHTLKLNPLISVPGLAGVVFLLSFAVAFVLRRIPLVKRYLV